MIHITLHDDDTDYRHVFHVCVPEVELVSGTSRNKRLIVVETIRKLVQNYLFNCPYVASYNQIEEGPQL